MSFFSSLFGSAGPVQQTNRFVAKAAGIFSDAFGVAEKVVDVTGINKGVSFLNSIPGAIVNHTTVSNLNYLNDKTAIPVPVDQDLNKTPTVSEFLNAAAAEYSLIGKPDGLKPFLVNGKQMYIMDQATGMSSKVWVTDKNQIIISFQGTGGGDNAFVNPLAGITGTASDVQIWNQQVTKAQENALGWTRHVVNEAQKQGYSTNDIFVTGHSLGAIEASYVGQQTGLGGMAFEATGVPSSSTAVGNGSNFVSVVTYGDPVANYASDTMAGNPFIAGQKPGQTGQFSHYGKVVFVGDKADNDAMLSGISGWGSGIKGDAKASGVILKDFINYHTPVVQAAGLGVDLSTRSVLFNTLAPGVVHGTSLDAGGNSLGQLIAQQTSSSQSVVASR